MRFLTVRSWWTRDRAVKNRTYDHRNSRFHVDLSIIHLPAATEVGLICVTNTHAQIMQRTLLEAEINHLRLRPVGVGQPDQVLDVLRSADQVYLSRYSVSAYPTTWSRKRAV